MYRWFLGSIPCLGGGFKHFLFSPRKLGKISNLTNIFQMGWNHQSDVNFQGFSKLLQNLGPCWRVITVDLATQDMGRGVTNHWGLFCAAKKGRMKGSDVKIFETTWWLLWWFTEFTDSKSAKSLVSLAQYEQLVCCYFGTFLSPDSSIVFSSGFVGHSGRALKSCFSKVHFQKDPKVGLLFILSNYLPVKLT